MGVHAQRIAACLSRFIRISHSSNLLTSPNSNSRFPYSTINVPKNPPKIASLPDETQILNELADLVPIRRSSSTIPNQLIETSPSKQLQTRAVDGFLPPEEKLRGVFLQKLKGKSAIERALSQAGVELDIDVFSKVVNRGNMGGEAMVIFFNWATKADKLGKSIESYNIILKALGRRKFFDFMVPILNDMKMEGIALASETLKIVLDSYVRAHRVSKAIQFFSQLNDFGGKCDTDSLNVLLWCLCHRAHVGAANSLLNKMKGKVTFDRMSYNHVISGWSRIGGVGEMEATLKMMVEDGITPDSSTFSYLIEGLGRAGKISDAIEIFKSMEEGGCVPDACVYNAIISNFLSIGDFDEALKYQECMLKNNCDPDIDTYTRMISAFLKAKRVADAIEMFDEMLGRGLLPTSGTITSFIEPLCSFGPPHAALMIYKKARNAGCVVSLSAYKLLLMRLSRFGKCGMLLNLWEDMQKSGHSSDMEVYEHVINGLCNAGQLQNAVLVMEESMRMGFCPSRLISSRLNNKLLASNEVEVAYKLFLKIRNARCSDNARKHWRAKGWHF